MLSGDITRRVDIKNLNRILKYELNARGIDLKYEYNIFNRNDGTPTKLISKSYSRNESDFKYITNLFPNDFFRSVSPLAMDIYFPHKEQFIYRSLGLLLSTSLLFTLSILLTFFFTFRTIINQKKLSEIKSDFINNMTHEFKTPIATINLATDNINNPMILNHPEHITVPLSSSVMYLFHVLSRPPTALHSLPLTCPPQLVSSRTSSHTPQSPP